MTPRTPGLLALPSSRPALESERLRLERELGHLAASAERPRRRSPSRFRRDREASAFAQARRLLAIERRRVLIRLDQLEERRS